MSFEVKCQLARIYLPAAYLYLKLFQHQLVIISTSFFLFFLIHFYITISWFILFSIDFKLLDIKIFSSRKKRGNDIHHIKFFSIQNF